MTHSSTLAQHYLNQLRLASRVQRGFLPETLPRCGPVSFQLVFRPVDYVSGDIYDVQRLDEEHVGIALADASGHGIPAALLTVYIKRALRGKEIEKDGYRLLSPDEVLSRLNDDVLEARLSECPFVAAVYAVLNVRTLRMSLARAGAPYPIHRRSDGSLRLIDAPGGVVGVVPKCRYELRTIELEPGDCILFYSDGLERVVAQVEPTAASQARCRAVPEPAHAACGSVASFSSPGPAAAAPVATFTDEIGLSNHPITRSAWYATLREQGAQVALAQIAGRQRTLRRMGYPLDDLTILAVQIDS